LVKSVLSAIPTFFLTVFKMPRWAFAKMDRIRRSFFGRCRNQRGLKEVTALLIGRHALDLKMGWPRNKGPGQIQ
jgi:hypothetical protein